MSKKEYARRFIMFIIGLFILSLGIALSTKASLGVSPVSSIPYVLSLAFPFSLGKITIAVQSLFIIFQIILLRKNFKPFQFLQIGVVVLFGYFNDFSLIIVSAVHPQHYPVQWVVCVISMFLIALGVNMEVRAGVLTLAVDGFVVTFSRVFKIDFGKVKVASDCIQVGVGVLLSFIFMHNLQGIREGTIAAAVFVGIIINKVYNKRLGWVFERIGLTPIQKPQVHGEETTATVPTFNRVITIAREVGSGGHEIGEILGKRLNVPVYNKDMLALAAKEFGMPAEDIEQKEQKMIYNFFQNIHDENYAPLIGEDSRQSKLKKVQQEVVQKVAAKEPCIIVGRLASYFLHDQPGCYHVFVHGQIEYRIEHFRAENNMTYDEAVQELERRDLERNRHYKYYTGMDYGYFRNYHLSINSALYGSEETADIILDAAERYFKDIEKNSATK